MSKYERHSLYFNEGDLPLYDYIKSKRKPNNWIMEAIRREYLRETQPNTEGQQDSLSRLTQQLEQLQQQVIQTQQQMMYFQPYTQPQMFQPVYPQSGVSMVVPPVAMGVEPQSMAQPVVEPQTVLKETQTSVVETVSPQPSEPTVKPDVELTKPVETVEPTKMIDPVETVQSVEKPVKTSTYHDPFASTDMSFM